MKWTRVAVPVLLLAAALVALAQSGPERSPLETLLENLAVGDQITLGTVRDADGYRISLLTADEVEAIRIEAEQYAAKRQEYEANREESQRLRAQYLRERDQEVRSELFSKLRGLTPPRRPDAVYRVFAVGKDYVGVSREKDEILVPISSIRQIRRRASGTQP